MNELMAVRVDCPMPRLNAQKIRRYAADHKILTGSGEGDGRGIVAGFGEWDSVQDMFNRLASVCKGMNEMELYNEIMAVEL